MGLSRDGYTHGFFLMGVMASVGVVMTLVGVFLAGRIRSRFSDSFSIGDVVGGPKSHNHRMVRLMMGIVSWILMSALTIIMSYAGGELLNNVFGFSKFWSIFLMTTIVIIYSSFGGIRATIQTDAFQFIVFVILIPLLGILMLMNPGFSWDAYAIEATDAANLHLSTQTGGAVLAVWLALTLSNTGLDAPIISRFLASRDAGVAKKALTMAGIFTIFWGVLLVFIGSAGAYLHPNFADSDQILLQIAEKHLPSVVYGIFVVAMLGVVMSTQDTTLNGSSIVFSQDILGSIFPGISDTQKLNYAKVYTIILGVAAIIIAVYITSALSAIITVVTYYLPMMLPVTLFAILKKKHYWQSAVVSMLAGLIFSLIWEYLGPEVLPTLLVGLSGSTIAYFLVDAILMVRPEKSFEV